MREHTYTPGDIIYTLQYHSQNQAFYRYLEPVRGDNTDECRETVNKAVNIAVRRNSHVVIPVIRDEDRWAVAVLYFDDADKKVHALYNDPRGYTLAEVSGVNEALVQHPIDIVVKDLHIKQLEHSKVCDTGPVIILNINTLVATKSLPNNDETTEKVITDLNETLLKEPQYRTLCADYYTKKISLRDKCQEVKKEFFPLEVRSNSILARFSFRPPQPQPQDMDQNDSRLEALNTIAKAYSSLPYTAIIECITQEKPLYIALSDTILKLDSNEIINIAKHLKNIVQMAHLGDNLLDAKIACFQEMFRTSNSILETFIQREHNKNSISHERKKYYNRLLGQLFLAEDEKHIDLGHRYFRDLVEENFSSCLKKEKLHLFKHLYKVHNPMLDPLIRRELAEYRRDNTLSSEREKYLDKLRLNLSIQHHNIDLDDRYFEEFINDGFSYMFQSNGLNSIRENLFLLDKMITGKFEVVHKPDKISGIHVEMQGVSFALRRDPQMKEFNIGLANATATQDMRANANSFFPSPYSCASCTTERGVVSNPQSNFPLTLNVTAISTDNFPPGRYVPSLNIIEEPKLFINYLSKIYQAASDRIQQGKNLPLHMRRVHDQLPEAEKALNTINTRRGELSELFQKLDVLEKQIDALPNSLKTPPSQNTPPHENDRELQQGSPKRRKIEGNESNEEDNNLRKAEKNFLKVSHNKVDDKTFKLFNTICAVNNESQRELLKTLLNGTKVRLDNNIQKYHLNSSKARDIGTVTFIVEKHHTRGHVDSVNYVMDKIQVGTIGRNTLIYLERKQEGNHLGMRDVCLLACIIQHNEKSEGQNRIKIPVSIIESPLYRDALLYSLARSQSIEVIGFEGKGLEGKETKDEAREMFMIKKIKENAYKGSDIICIVGKTHINALEEGCKNEGLDVKIEMQNSEVLKGTSHLTNDKRAQKLVQETFKKEVFQPLCKAKVTGEEKMSSPFFKKREYSLKASIQEKGR